MAITSPSTNPSHRRWEGFVSGRWLRGRGGRWSKMGLTQSQDQYYTFRGSENSPSYRATSHPHISGDHVAGTKAYTTKRTTLDNNKRFSKCDKIAHIKFSRFPGDADLTKKVDATEGSSVCSLVHRDKERSPSATKLTDTEWKATTVPTNYSGLVYVIYRNRLDLRSLLKFTFLGPTFISLLSASQSLASSHVCDNCRTVQKAAPCLMLLRQQKYANSTRCSQVVTLCCLTVVVRREPVLSVWYGRQNFHQKGAGSRGVTNRGSLNVILLVDKRIHPYLVLNYSKSVIRITMNHDQLKAKDC
ncbi:hypothetical protein AVEN_241383-1 [Araneus ventricosus]|uniref:Uncharacterized protein n=1 Tax=Araneus ventricosus TaxID=182803 RepID=A0A4Y2M9D0_ARAVE|nr:hypothetical protein AVEN_241383-1 [Araneus ventricosus]